MNPLTARLGRQRQGETPQGCEREGKRGRGQESDGVRERQRKRVSRADTRQQQSEGCLLIRAMESKGEGSVRDTE